jgi:hypothetical protein
VVEDIGQIAVVRDEGDIILPANPYDLRSLAVAFARNGVGTYDPRPSSRSFQSAVGQKITLGDDDSASVTLPFTVPFYSGRFNQLFVNSDGNITFVSDDRASTERDVSRFLTGPPRIALLFDDLDPSAGGGVFRRIDTTPSSSRGATCRSSATPEPRQRAAAHRIRRQSRLHLRHDRIGYGGGGRRLAGRDRHFQGGGRQPGGDDRNHGWFRRVGERFSQSQELDFVALGRRFYQSHPDDFDQFVIFANARTTERGVFAFEFTVANEVSGIGVDIYDSSRDFGSAGRLRSIVNMDALFKYPDDPRQKFLGENNTLSILGQECGHRWLAYMEFRDGATNSGELLGRDQSHWSFFFDSDASNMEGNDITTTATARSGPSAPCRSTARWISTRWACGCRPRCRRCSWSAARTEAPNRRRKSVST